LDTLQGSLGSRSRAISYFSSGQLFIRTLWQVQSGYTSKLKQYKHSWALLK